MSCAHISRENEWLCGTLLLLGVGGKPLLLLFNECQLSHGHQQTPLVTTGEVTSGLSGWTLRATLEAWIE
jgi:hypothetical protein